MEKLYSIIKAFILMIMAISIGCSENRKEQNTNEHKENPTKILIENKIGFSFPDFIEINSDNSAVTFNGDYTNTIILKFKDNTNLDNFYSEIKKRVESPRNLNYEKVNGCITLTDEWGVNVHGEYSYAFMSECADGDDKDFSLVINSKDSIVTLSHGYW
ncbi:hypothetical protein [Dysgonomonas mossii]|uniref:hypothetical protein n=1 Tax=Dysgonomonas mossii TaxID=163665 RepID=UPI0039937A3F